MNASRLFLFVSTGIAFAVACGGLIARSGDSGSGDEAGISSGSGSSIGDAAGNESGIEGGSGGSGMAPDGGAGGVECPPDAGCQSAEQPCLNAAGCGIGQLCCFEPDGAVFRARGHPPPGSTICENASCPVGRASQICTTPAECPNEYGCTNTVFGISLCTPLPCTPPGGTNPCGAGEVCCTNGMTATCQVAASTGGCATQQQVCTSDDQCPPSASHCIDAGGGLAVYCSP